MDNVDFPFILSPAPGCPEIVTLANNGGAFSAVVAATDARLPDWNLIPSASNGSSDLKPIPLKQTDLKELPKGSFPEICTVGDTRDVFSGELLGLLGGNIRIFKVSLAFRAEPSQALREAGARRRPTVYDLTLGGHVKSHAVCLRDAGGSGHHFIHLTDLHLARRNDLAGPELSNFIGPLRGFNNFNDRVREFIGKANGFADAGELDFVLISGDMVDFVNHGVSDNGLDQDNNWQVFLDILTGGGYERQQGNCGIRVPVFTSTGNHDWRLHPYDMSDAADGFGVDRFQASRFDYEYYDTIQNIEAKKEAVYNKIVKEGSFVSRDSFHHTALKWLLRKSETWPAKALVPFIAAALSYFPFDGSGVIPAAAGLLAAVAHRLINMLLSGLVRRIISSAVIPIEAGVQALHHYFLHVNPYMNYAFSFGASYFIMMDTGPDCFTGQYLWDEGNKKMGRLSVMDNIMGGSPDSMAFFGANEYYSYGQIPWLEKVLNAAGAGNRDGEDVKKRIFICLHAPPINIKDSVEIPDGTDEMLLREGEVDIRHGTVNHFLSQFYHLCIGEKENDPGYLGPKVDIVFSGHTHRKVEFRIGHGPEIHAGAYSGNSVEGFDERRPFAVQTCACGPLSPGYPQPPYFRRIHVDGNGVIQSFKQSR